MPDSFLYLSPREYSQPSQPQSMGGAEWTKTERNREAQRRSRQRRGDYVKLLEDRVRQFESQGTTATIEVQSAAQRVIEENNILRELLATQGWTRDSLEEHLRRSRNTALPTPPRSAVPIPISRLPIQPLQRHPQSPLTASPQRSETASLPQTSEPPTSENDSPTPPQMQESQQAYKSERRCGGCREDRNLSEDPEGSLCPPENREQMHCEEAARIISSIRGSTDVRAVWTELGCSTSRQTFVSHKTVFDLAN